MRIAVVLLCTLACDSTPAPAPAPTTAPTTDSGPPAKPELVESGVAAEIRASLQGTFAMSWWRGGPDRHPEVWSIAGDTITRWDGTKEHTATMLVVAPCVLRVDWANGEHTYEEFVIDGDTIWFGEEGGWTSNGRTVVCTSRGVWVLEGETCTRWEPGGFSRRASGLSPEDAKCTRSADGSFEAGTQRFVPRGDVLVRADFDARKPKPPVRFDDLAKAKAAAATL